MFTEKSHGPIVAEQNRTKDAKIVETLLQREHANCISSGEGRMRRRDGISCLTTDSFPLNFCGQAYG